MTEVEKSRAHIFVTGRVQRVAFRYSTQQAAETAGVVGWVRNLPDGRVELVAEGERKRVEQLLAWCHDGPRLARVDRVDVTWEESCCEPPGFRIT